MALIRVTSAQLKGKADELKNQNSQFKAKVEALVTSEANLSAMWKGDANDAFRNAFNTDKVKWDTFHALIEQYITTLNAIAAEYDRQEAANVSIATKRG